MIDLPAEVIRRALICSVGAWGVVEGLKPIAAKYMGADWRRAATRCLALACGAGFGYGLAPGAEGALVGLCGGALSTTVVAGIKALLKKGQPSSESDS